MIFSSHHQLIHAFFVTRLLTKQNHTNYIFNQNVELRILFTAILWSLFLSAITKPVEQYADWITKFKYRTWILSISKKFSTCCYLSKSFSTLFNMTSIAALAFESIIILSSWKTFLLLFAISKAFVLNSSLLTTFK